jgi:hypothetical protein
MERGIWREINTLTSAERHLHYGFTQQGLCAQSMHHAPTHCAREHMRRSFDRRHEACSRVSRRVHLSPVLFNFSRTNGEALAPADIRIWCTQSCRRRWNFPDVRHDGTGARAFGHDAAHSRIADRRRTRDRGLGEVWTTGFRHAPRDASAPGQSQGRAHSHPELMCQAVARG